MVWVVSIFQWVSLGLLVWVQFATLSCMVTHHTTTLGNAYITDLVTI